MARCGAAAASEARLHAPLVPSDHARPHAIARMDSNGLPRVRGAARRGISRIGRAILSPGIRLHRADRLRSPASRRAAGDPSIGGLIGGALVGLAYNYADRRRSRALGYVLAGGLAVVAVVGGIMAAGGSGIG